jgi:hypothetical protein
MDQILPMVEAVLSRLDWISAGISGLCVALAGVFATLFARSFVLEGLRYTIIWFVIVALTVWPVRTGAKTYLAPTLYEWNYEERIVQELARTPLYSALLEHHPEARKPLVRATIKIMWNRREALVGQIELGAIVMHYLALDLPRTSDMAAKQFATAVMGLFHHMMVQDPGACIEMLYGSDNERDAHKRFARLSPVVLERLAQVGGTVIVDAAVNATLAPDPNRIENLRQRVAARMTQDGNPLATDPERLMSDPHRACFAVLALFESAWKSVPEEELGAFIRGVMPAYLTDDET